MELDELKQNWELLNKRLETNEVLNKRIIKEMITQRTSNSYNKLLHVEIISLIIVVILIPLSLILPHIVKYPATQPWLIGILIFATLASLWQIIKIRWLKKFDIENKSIYQLSTIIHTYRKWIIKENCILIPLVVLFLALRFITAHAQNHPWFAILLISVMILVPVHEIMFYYLFHKKHFSNINKNLDELKEFKEE